MRAAAAARRLTDAERRERSLARLERVTEPFLLLMAFVMVPLVVGPFLWDLSGFETTVFAILSTFVWIAFALDFGIKLAIAPRRGRFLRKHWLEAAIVVVPFFRPLYLVRFVLFGSRAILGMRRLAEIDFVIVLATGVVIIGATVMYSIDTANAAVDSFGDALWWSIVTVTTVGYGDIVPGSTGGRIVAFFVMVSGIALFGAVAGNVAALLARVSRRGTEERSPTASLSDRSARLDDLLAEVRLLREQVGALQTTVASLEQRRPE
jgi:voltage-gated potassium channel